MRTNGVCRRDRKLHQRSKDEMTRMYGGGGADMSVDDYHVAMSTPDTPVVSKFLPFSSADSGSVVAHYDTAGRLTDVQPTFTSCAGGWHPGLSVVDAGSTCYQPSTAAAAAVRLAAAPPGRGWQLRRHADHEHDYELPK